MLRVLCDVVLCHPSSCVERLVRWRPELEAGDAVVGGIVAGNVVPVMFCEMKSLRRR